MPSLRKPLKIDSFARFYKGYLNVWSVAAAALPIPVTSLHIIPAFRVQRPFLTLYSSLFCFLLLGFAFYCRHTIARGLVPRRDGARALFHFALMVLPGALILLTVGFVLAYHWILQDSLMELMRRGVKGAASVVLDKADYLDIPSSIWLALTYLGMFMCAEAAFIIMALKEYLLDVHALSEAELADSG
jgi:hypothetical protein